MIHYLQMEKMFGGKFNQLGFPRNGFTVYHQTKMFHGDLQTITYRALENGSIEKYHSGYDMWENA